MRPITWDTSYVIPFMNSSYFFTVRLSMSSKTAFLASPTQCFFARLGFVQPPSCLKCAHRSSRCSSAESGASNQINYNQCNADGAGRQESASERSSSCSELVAWRIDANIPLHPDNLEGNIVFITCDTAKSLVNGDAYPSIRWDIRNKRLLHEKVDHDISKVDRFCWCYLCIHWENN